MTFRATSTSLDKALDILETVASDGAGATLGELVAKLGLPKTTVHRLVASLERRGYLATDGQGYVPGLKLASLGRAALDRINLRESARRSMEALASLTGETVHLSIRDKLETVCVERVEGTNSVRLFMQVGRRAPLYRGSSAKILLAYADPPIVDAVLQALPPSENRDAIRDQIAETRRNGYVVTHGDLDQYAIGIAAPITDHTGKVAAALSLAGLESRLGDARLQQSIAEVRDCAREISRSLGTTVPAHGGGAGGEGAGGDGAGGDRPEVTERTMTERAVTVTA